ncbi:MAG: hypothetical protein GTO63_24320 [Anaerolineae bacterium]|nr:hypothetical protein [Anaerolineae bacterium]NIN97849.1 hypothetical protein [Anaerolineae bacterium]
MKLIDATFKVSVRSDMTDAEAEVIIDDLVAQTEAGLKAVAVRLVELFPDAGIVVEHGA